MDIEKLRYLCDKYWNPIGVPMGIPTNDTDLGYPPLPADEYDQYLSVVYNMLVVGDDEKEIIKYLSIVEEDYLMLTRPNGDKNMFIRALRDNLNQ